MTKEVLGRLGLIWSSYQKVKTSMSLAKMILFQHRIEVFQLDEAVEVAEFTVPASWVSKKPSRLGGQRSTISILSAIEMRKTNRFIFRLGFPFCMAG